MAVQRFCNVALGRVAQIVEHIVDTGWRRPVAQVAHVAFSQQRLE
jgi:hypothetical protein